MQFPKVLLVSFLGFASVWAANYFLGLTHIQLGSASTIAVYLLISFFFLYLPVPKRRLFVKKDQKIEYLVNGKGQMTNKIFNSAEYSDYIEIEHNADGRIFTDPLGKIVCTRYAVSEQADNGMIRVHLVFLCLVSICLSILYENLIPLIETGQLEATLTRWSNGWEQRNLEIFGAHIGNNVQQIAQALSTIRLELDLASCLEIIKENLERLSILQFT